MLTWRDTTKHALDYFLGLRALLGDAALPSPDNEAAQREQGTDVLHAYMETLEHLGGRTGMLIARRQRDESDV